MQINLTPLQAWFVNKCIEEKQAIFDVLLMPDEHIKPPSFEEIYGISKDQLETSLERLKEQLKHQL